MRGRPVLWDDGVQQDVTRCFVELCGLRQLHPEMAPEALTDDPRVLLALRALDATAAVVTPSSGTPQ